MIQDRQSPPLNSWGERTRTHSQAKSRDVPQTSGGRFGVGPGSGSEPPNAPASMGDRKAAKYRILSMDQASGPRRGKTSGSAGIQDAPLTPDHAALDYEFPWGCSSAGRALRSQCRGRQFDPDQLHQNPLEKSRGFLLQTPPPGPSNPRPLRFLTVPSETLSPRFGGLCRPAGMSGLIAMRAEGSARGQHFRPS